MTDKKLSKKWPIIGHHSIIDFFQASIDNNKISHAYLFFGSNNIGRRVVAKNFILTLLCSNKEAKPCFACSTCKQIEKGIHPDVFFLNKEDDKKNISVEQVRELQSKLSLGSFLNNYKVAVIDGAENLSLAASNALLKTLEEPATKTILILITNSVASLPDTISSRCQILRFLPVPEKFIFNYLLEQDMNRKGAEDLAHLSLGRPGIALNFLHNKEKLEEYKKFLNDFLSLTEFLVYEKFFIIDDLIKKADSVKEKDLFTILNIWQIALRDFLLVKYGKEELISNRFASEKIIELAKKYSVEQLVVIMRDLKKTKKYLHQNINQKLALENFTLNL